MNHPYYVPKGGNVNYSNYIKNDGGKSWTDNKYYIQASSVTINDKLPKSNQNDEFLHKIKEFYNFAFREIPENNKLEYFSEYRENIINNYTLEKNKLKFQQFENLKSKLLDISQNEKENNDKIRQLQFSDGYSNDSLKFVKNYWFELFKDINFKSLPPNNYQKLKLWINAYDKKKNAENSSPIHNINSIQNTTSKSPNQTNIINNINNNAYNNKDFDDFLTNLSKNIENSNKNNDTLISNYNTNTKPNSCNMNYTSQNQNNHSTNQQNLYESKNEVNLIDLDDFPSVPKPNTSSNYNQNRDISYKDINISPNSIQTLKNTDNTKYIMNRADYQENLSDTIIYEEFKQAVGNKNLSEEVCLSYLFSCNKNVLEAVNLFFQDKYNSKNLKVTYIFPDKSEVTSEFSFVGNCDELFLALYRNPKINNPEISYNNRKLEINPLTDRYIGNLNISNNAKLVVKSS